MANITTANVIINVSIYFSATYWTIINATIWEFPKRENGGTHDRHKGLFCALANWPLPCKDGRLPATRHSTFSNPNTNHESADHANHFEKYTSDAQLNYFARSDFLGSLLFLFYTFLRRSNVLPTNIRRIDEKLIRRQQIMLRKEFVQVIVTNT